MRVELRIDRLVLDDKAVSREHADTLRRAVEFELSRLLVAAPSASWQRSRRMRRVTGPDVVRAGAAGLGAGIARSVYEAVGRAD
ncbi:hypothetical protein ACQP2Y_12385 [Actinoplanes sp. CA-051413]|uniref:hypothetical protein n=1 Tax=Actinoplanes sp. CA-051413 TaxID=3239899 RepID=UPI003D9640E9